MNSPEVRPIPTKSHDYTRAIVWGIVLAVGACEAVVLFNLVAGLIRGVMA